MRYAQRINRAKGWKGHLWQGRFFSSPLDDNYLFAAVRYIEQNPIRVGLADKAEDYRWSSAAAHCGLREDKVLCHKYEWKNVFASIEDWSGWLEVEESDDKREVYASMLKKVCRVAQIVLCKH